MFRPFFIRPSSDRKFIYRGNCTIYTIQRKLYNTLYVHIVLYILDRGNYNIYNREETVQYIICTYCIVYTGQRKLYNTLYVHIVYTGQRKLYNIYNTEETVQYIICTYCIVNTAQRKLYNIYNTICTYNILYSFLDK